MAFSFFDPLLISFRVRKYGNFERLLGNSANEKEVKERQIKRKMNQFDSKTGINIF